MSLSKKELNKLKSELFRRDLLFYITIEKELNRLRTKELKIAYLNQIFNERRSVEFIVWLMKESKAYRTQIIKSATKKYYPTKGALEFFKTIEKFPDNEKFYIYSLFSESMENFIDSLYTSTLERDIALHWHNIENLKNEKIKIEDIEEVGDFFGSLSYPLNGKEKYQELSKKIPFVNFITILEPSFWRHSSGKTAYVKIDFSQPIDVIIEVIKGIKKIIDEDTHDILTADELQVLSGNKTKEMPLPLDTLLKKRNTIFSLEEKLTDIIYIYDCKKINMPDSKIRDNLFAYYQDKKDTDNLDDTLRIAISNYKKVLKQLNTDFSPFD